MSRKNPVAWQTKHNVMLNFIQRLIHGRLTWLWDARVRFIRSYNKEREPIWCKPNHVTIEDSRLTTTRLSVELVSPRLARLVTSFIATEWRTSILPVQDQGTSKIERWGESREGGREGAIWWENRWRSSQARERRNDDVVETQDCPQYLINSVAVLRDLFRRKLSRVRLGRVSHSWRDLRLPHARRKDRRGLSNRLLTGSGVWSRVISGLRDDELLR